MAAVLSQVANVLLGGYWLVVGCWLLVAVVIGIVECSCNCPFTSPASLPEESYSITWICRLSDFGIQCQP